MHSTIALGATKVFGISVRLVVKETLRPEEACESGAAADKD